MRILFLDDDRRRHELFREWAQAKGQMNVTHAYTADGAAEYMAENDYNLVFLDHDLADEHYGSGLGERPGDGTGLARWMVDHWRSSGRVVVHSWNPDGAGRMVALLAPWKAVHVPFGPALKEYL